MPIQPQYLCLAELLARRLFRIPEYQRAYSWQHKQREDLFEDLRRVHRIGGDEVHFMATVVGLRRRSRRVGTDEFTEVEVVDGQQRLTTLVVLYKALALALDRSEPRQAQLAAELEGLLVKGDDVTLLLLQPNHDTGQQFAAYLRHGTHPSAAAAATLADRALLAAMDDCARFVDEWTTPDRATALFELATILKNRLAFIFHEIDDEATVYTVFEVLNSRGLDVSWFDRLKSILMGLAFTQLPDGSAEAISELRQAWSDIYRCIGLRQGFSDEALVFAATLRSKTPQSRVLGEEDAVETFRALGAASPRQLLDESQWILEVTRAVNALLADRRRAAVTKVGQARLLAVAIVLRGFSATQTEALLRGWERVTFRIYGMFDRDARHKVGDYVRLAWRITAQQLDAAKIAAELVVLGKDYPIDQAVARLRDADCYEGWEAEVRYFFARYEEHCATTRGQTFDNEQWNRIWTDSAARSIEHIQPQSKGAHQKDDTKIFVHRLGNLVLLPPGLNSKLSNRDPAMKVDEYRKSGLFIAQDVADQLVSWTRATVEEREAVLLAWAQQEWG